MTVAEPRHLLWLVAGFGLWATALVTLYALHAVGCTYGWTTPSLRFSMGAVLAGFLLALAVLVQRAHRAQVAGSIGRIGRWTLVAALAATLLTYGPTLLLTPCS